MAAQRNIRPAIGAHARRIRGQIGWIADNHTTIIWPYGLE
jgi:hypothetical protein